MNLICMEMNLWGNTFLHECLFTVKDSIWQNKGATWKQHQPIHELSLKVNMNHDNKDWLWHWYHKVSVEKSTEGRGPMITSLPTYPWLYSFSAIFMVSFAFIFNFLEASFSSSYKCKGYMSRVNLIFIYTAPVIATGFVSVGKFSSYCKNKWKVFKIELFACHEILAFKTYLLLAGLKCVTCRLNQFKAEMPQFTWIIILWHDCLIFKNPSVIPGIKLFQNDQHRYHYNTSNLLTTVSKGSGLHLLLGRDEVLWTFAVGFLQRKNSIDQQIYSKYALINISFCNYICCSSILSLVQFVSEPVQNFLNQYKFF